MSSVGAVREERGRSRQPLGPRGPVVVPLAGHTFPGESAELAPAHLLRAPHLLISRGEWTPFPGSSSGGVGGVELSEVHAPSPGPSCRLLLLLCARPQTGK